MRLIILGDSGSSGGHGWPRFLSEDINYELINFAVPGATNLLQIQLSQDWLLDNNLTKDDIVIWQIGWSTYPVVYVGMEHWDKVERAERVIKKYLFASQYYLRNNKVDRKPRISLLRNSPILHKFTNRKKSNDVPEVLQNLLFMFTIIKIMCPKLLVVKGRDGMVSEEYWENMKNFFTEKNIDFINDSLHGWCTNRKLDFFPDNEHVPEHSNRTLVTELMYPKLKTLGWI
jgi:hypothetical protein